MGKVIRELNLKEGSHYLFALRKGNTIKAKVVNLVDELIVLESNGTVEEMKKDDIYFYSKVG